MTNIFKRKLHIHKFKKIKPTFFHGKLHIHIIEARDLPNLDALTLKINDLTDPYVTVDALCCDQQVAQFAKTRVISDNLNPFFNEQFLVDVCHLFDSLKVVVKDKDVTGSDVVGCMSIPAKELISSKEIEGWYTLRNNNRERGSIHVKIQYISYDDIITSYTVPDVPFPLRNGCSVTLYQDAHTPAEPPLTDIKDERGNSYKPPQLWVDLSDAFEKAEKLIYILGWSVNTSIRLLREGIEEDLGTLLKRKADEGVRVLIMIWDEPLNCGLLPGLMGVYDEETINYFKGTNVHVCKALRSVENGNLYENTIYTHHQKCTIVDTECIGGNKRKLTVFQGGIDLTIGRWDTPEHSLHKTLQDEHKGDFYNKVKKCNPDSGPRQPWHDIHQKLEGKIAEDILTNFIQRWNKQASSLKYLLLPSADDEFDLDWKDKHYNTAQDGEIDGSWNVQFFRSINADSVHLDFDKFCGGVGYEDSIHEAYIHHIRRSKRFIYIENQYFLGSSFIWKESPSRQSTNLIPLELTTRIINAICRKEDFRVYILIPLHSEGDPNSAAVQEILLWQYRTIHMMYSKISKAIHKSNIDAHPTDYLSFYCLGKREDKSEEPIQINRAGRKNNSRHGRKPSERLVTQTRFMIYIHSKMAIFDDEYIIVGSANINERSMNGNRDTEIATGAYQPIGGNTNKAHDRGDISKFRMALWAEHCGVHMHEHLFPSSSKCMIALNKLAHTNLHRYFSSETANSKSHLMSYPMDVGRNGEINFMNGMKRFPDTGGNIFGSSNFLPDSLTA